jgi:ankyrin repeat protein
MYKIVNLSIIKLLFAAINVYASDIITNQEPRYSSMYTESTNTKILNQSAIDNVKDLVLQNKPIANATLISPLEINIDNKKDIIVPQPPVVPNKPLEINIDNKKDIIVPQPPVVPNKPLEINIDNKKDIIKSKNIQSKPTKQKDEIIEEEIIIEEVLLETELYERPVYDHKTVKLSPNISKKTYSENNRHLPKVFYQSEYTSLLFEAVRSNDIQGIKSLIEKGANINAQEISNGYTPIMYAIKYNRLKALRSLIIHGADLQKVNLEGQTPLHIAINNGNAQAIEILMTGGADPTIKDKKGNRPADYMKANMQNSAMIMVGNYQDKTKALIDFVGLSAYDAVKSALDAGAKIDAKDQLTTDGDTPLIIAIKCQDIKMISLLLNRGASLYVPNKKGKTPMQVAVELKNDIVIGILHTVKINREIESMTQK